MKQLQEITKKTDTELAELIRESRAELAKAVIDSRTKETHDTKKLGRLKKTIARVLTIAREREIAAQEAAE
jgi:large subunit ribosomal protein L29